MANVAALLSHRLATPDRVLYRQFTGGAWRDFTVREITELAAGWELVRRANERLKGFPRYIRVRRAIASPEPWTVENGLLTPTMKVKRNQVLKRFAPEIEKAYASGATAE